MYTSIKMKGRSVINDMGLPGPEKPLSFCNELRQVLQQRNLLTAKTCNKDLTDGSRGIPTNTEVDKRHSFRMQAVQEIIDSEKSYLHQLEVLMEYFVKPLKQKRIIDELSHGTLFGQVEMIYNLNGEFLKELESNRNKVATAFLKMAPFFKLYSIYAFDYRHALLVLQDLLSKNVAFRKFLESNESRPEVQCKLNSLMIVPIQRLPRYKLLLEQVILYTSPADCDFKFLKESIKQIENTVSHINSCVEDQETTQMLINLQNSLCNRSPNVVKPSRKIIKEGVLQKITRHGEGIRRYCVLMSDIFMYCKILKDRSPNTVVDNSLECCCIFPLKKSKVYELLPGSFKISCQGDSIILSSPDLQTCNVWVGLVRDAIELHKQCYMTLRKESSKRTPLRKKEVKNFGKDYMLSPHSKKFVYDGIFRNKNRSNDVKEDCSYSKVWLNCKRKIPKRDNFTSSLLTNDDGVILRKTSAKTENRLSKIYKSTSNDKLFENTKSILKNQQRAVNATELPRPSIAYRSHNDFAQSSYRKPSNPINSNNKPNQTQQNYDMSPAKGTHFSKMTFNNENTASRWESENMFSPPQKKRVKFDDTSNMLYNFNSSKVNTNPDHHGSRSLREKIYGFFANLF